MLRLLSPERFPRRGIVTSLDLPSFAMLYPSLFIVTFWRSCEELSRDVVRDIRVGRRAVPLVAVAAQNKVHGTLRCGGLAQLTGAEEGAFLDGV